MLDKTVLILDYLASEGRAFRLTELSSGTGLSKTTVHRLVGELVRHGLLERSGHSYTLGGRLFYLGSSVPHRWDLREVALPFLHDLFEATRETVHLGVREGHEVVYVERFHGHDALPLPSRIGGSLPLHCTGVGKALLAFSTSELVEEVLAGSLPRMTPRSLDEPERLRAAIAQVRTSGLAYEEEEAVSGVSCVAAPVFSGHIAVAALSVAVPVDRYHPARLAPAVRTAALALSRVLRSDRNWRRL